MIRVNFSKQLRDYTLDVDFEVVSGSCMALVGPTGCGKTTTLRLIAGLETPDAGAIEIDGDLLVDAERRVLVPPQERRLGVVFQDYALFPHMSVLQNVMYGATARGVGKKQAERQAHEALTRVKLTGLQNQKPWQLSGGQQQRVALARAIASDPRALLMDEPLAALDVGTRRHVRSELRGIITELGMQTIIVTHDVVDALSLGDTICVMDNGRIIQIGDRAELLSRPRTQFVADFLGVNLLPCTAGALRDGLREIHCGSAVFYTTDDAEGDALLTCNPWDVSLSRERPGGSALNILRGRISEMAHVGGRTRVTVEDGVSLAAEITHASEQRLNLHIGEEIYASFKASAARVYK